MNWWGALGIAAGVSCNGHRARSRAEDEPRPETLTVQYLPDRYCGQESVSLSDFEVDLLSEACGGRYCLRSAETGAEDAVFFASPVNVSAPDPLKVPGGVAGVKVELWEEASAQLAQSSNAKDCGITSSEDNVARVYVSHPRKPNPDVADAGAHSWESPYYILVRLRYANGDDYTYGGSTAAEYYFHSKENRWRYCTRSRDDELGQVRAEVYRDTEQTRLPSVYGRRWPKDDLLEEKPEILCSHTHKSAFVIALKDRRAASEPRATLGLKIWALGLNPRYFLIDPRGSENFTVLDVYVESTR